MRALFVRHGESTGNVGGRLVGRSDPPLSPVGRRQAELVARRLRNVAFTSVVTSPSRRAADTASLIAAEGTAPVLADEGWQEMDYGEWEGLAMADLHPPPGGPFFDAAEFRPPRGESMGELRDRVLEAWGRLDTGDGVVCVVSHMGPIKSILLDALTSPTATFRQIRIDQGSISEIFAVGTKRIVQRMNDVAHLERDFT